MGSCRLNSRCANADGGAVKNVPHEKQRRSGMKQQRALDGSIAKPRPAKRPRVEQDDHHARRRSERPKRIKREDDDDDDGASAASAAVVVQPSREMRRKILPSVEEGEERPTCLAAVGLDAPEPLDNGTFDPAGFYLVWSVWYLGLSAQGRWRAAVRESQSPTAWLFEMDDLLGLHDDDDDDDDDDGVEGELDEEGDGLFLLEGGEAAAEERRRAELAAKRAELKAMLRGHLVAERERFQDRRALNDRLREYEGRARGETVRQEKERTEREEQEADAGGEWRVTGVTRDEEAGRVRKIRVSRKRQG